MEFYRVLKLDNGERELCIRDKEVRSCYELFRTRAEIHNAVQHPVVKGNKRFENSLLQEKVLYDIVYL